MTEANENGPQIVVAFQDYSPPFNAEINLDWPHPKRQLKRVVREWDLKQRITRGAYAVRGHSATNAVLEVKSNANANIVLEIIAIRRMRLI